MSIRYPLQTAGGGSGSGSLEGAATYACDAGVAVGHVVYVSGADAVELAEADGSSSFGRLAVVTEKVTSTSCRVLYAGDAPFFVGLTMGASYYLSDTPGAITSARPASPSTVQLVGYPRNATTLVFDPDQTTIRQA